MIFRKFASSFLLKASPLFVAPRINLRNFSTAPSWKILRLNHIALGTPSTESAASFYSNKFHLSPSAKVPQPDHGVNTVFVDVGNTKLELLDQLGDKSPIAAFMSKNPAGGIHHLCFEVDNIDAAVEDLKGQGVRLLGDKPKIGAHGKPVIFIHPKDCGGVLIELEQA